MSQVNFHVHFQFQTIIISYCLFIYSISSHIISSQLVIITKKALQDPYTSDRLYHFSHIVTLLQNIITEQLIPYWWLNQRFYSPVDWQAVDWVQLQHRSPYVSLSWGGVDVNARLSLGAVQGLQVFYTLWPPQIRRGTPPAPDPLDCRWTQYVCMCLMGHVCNGACLLPINFLHNETTYIHNIVHIQCSQTVFGHIKYLNIIAFDEATLYRPR